jgi:PleD family two-component response regulator
VRVAERIMADLRSRPVRLKQTPAIVTVTIGICTAAQADPSLDLFAAADRALYAGKSRGRDVIEVATI